MSFSGPAVADSLPQPG
ncbi:Protein of unknown function [Bacillus mycoides]|nr:Protein of unknown function [Bacillus mycoides]